MMDGSEIKVCDRETLKNQIGFHDTIYEEEETLIMFPSINLACAHTLMGMMQQTVLVEDSISNVQYFMPLIESINKKCADGYFITIEAVMQARLPPVRSPSPESSSPGKGPFTSISKIHSKQHHKTISDQPRNVLAANLVNFSGGKHVQAGSNKKAEISANVFQKSKESRNHLGKSKNFLLGPGKSHRLRMEDSYIISESLPHLQLKNSGQIARQKNSFRQGRLQLNDYRHPTQWNFNLDQDYDQCSSLEGLNGVSDISSEYAEYQHNILDSEEGHSPVVNNLMTDSDNYDQSFANPFNSNAHFNAEFTDTQGEDKFSSEYQEYHGEIDCMQQIQPQMYSSFQHENLQFQVYWLWERFKKSAK